MHLLIANAGWVEHLIPKRIVRLKRARPRSLRISPVTKPAKPCPDKDVATLRITVASPIPSDDKEPTE